MTTTFPTLPLVVQKRYVTFSRFLLLFPTLPGPDSFYCQIQCGSWQFWPQRLKTVTLLTRGPGRLGDKRDVTDAGSRKALVKNVTSLTRGPGRLGEKTSRHWQRVPEGLGEKMLHHWRRVPENLVKKSHVTDEGSRKALVKKRHVTDEGSRKALLKKRHITDGGSQMTF